MALKELLVNKKNDLRYGRFTSEAAVSQGIILPILNEIGWPVFDTHVVWPEYTAGGGRVDYALCNPPDRPVIFVEVKRVGQAEGADRQLFEYAFHQGVPMAVLTDGQEWHFYLPAEQGQYQDRRVYKLDLIERDLDECVKRLKRYLDYKEVASGAALDAAKADYRDINRDRQISNALPIAWQQLIEQPDDLLSEFLADKVEDICGYKPNIDICSEYIRSIKPPSQAPSPDKTIGKVPKVPKTSLPHTRKTTTGRTGYTYRGQFHPCGSAREVMVNILQEFDRMDTSFLDRFASRKHGRKRRFIARDRYELYPGRPDLADNHYYELKPGWYVGTNYSKQNIADIIRMACDVASIKFRTDLIIEL
jgi:hypothetical protein